MSNDLHSISIKGTGEGPHLLITAGIHGDEFEGIFAVLRLIEEVKADSLHGTLTLIPIANPSAVENHARTGEDGKDLARTFPGNSKGSSTERIAASLNEAISSADLYIDLHSGGRVMDVYPLCGYGLVRDESVLNNQRRMAQAFGLPLVWGTSPDLDGRSLSAARDAGVAAIYAEYRGRGICDSEGIDAYVKGCQAVMTEFGMLDHALVPRPDACMNPLVVEDPRPDSGHLQVCHPSPIRGLFQPTVSLGQTVSKGDSLGVVLNPYGPESEEIAADHAGTIIVIRSYPQVDESDALAVILENNNITTTLDPLPPC